MEAEHVERDEVSYSACIYACEASGAGAAALHVLQLMKAERHPPNSATYKAAMWACVKSGLWREALRLLDEVEEHKVPLTEDVCHAAIWACESACRDGSAMATRAVDILKNMKLMKLERKTIAYDGALSALSSEGSVATTYRPRRSARSSPFRPLSFSSGRWEEALDMLTWMDREPGGLKRSATTYSAVIEALDAVPGQEVLLTTYITALDSSQTCDCVRRLRRVMCTKGRCGRASSSRGRRAAASSTCAPFPCPAPRPLCDPCSAASARGRCGHNI